MKVVNKSAPRRPQTRDLHERERNRLPAPAAHYNRVEYLIEDGRHECEDGREVGVERVGMGRRLGMDEGCADGVEGDLSYVRNCKSRQAK